MTASEHAHAFAVDLSSNPRLPVLMDLMRGLGHAADEPQTIGVFVDAMRRAYGPTEYLGLNVRGLAPGEFRIVRWLGIDGAERVPPTVGEEASAPVRRGGVLGAVVAGGQPTLLRGLRAAGDAVTGDVLARFRSMIAAPIMRAGEVTDWAVLLDDDPAAFDETALEDLLLNAGLIGTVVHNLETARSLRAANAWISREIEEIAQIQRAMLPERAPEIAGLRIETAYETYDRAGGDYFTFFPLPERQEAETAGVPAPPGVPGAGDTSWGVFIADASGHGPAAAVVTAMLHAMIYSLPGDMISGCAPAGLLAHLNRRLCARGLERQFATAIAAWYDPRTRRMVYSRAGHPPPLVKRMDTEEPSQRLDGAGGLPLGITEDAAYDQAEVTLEPGQTVVMYTDGITEALSPVRVAGPAANDVPEAGWGALARPAEMFGVAGIERALRACSGAPDCVIRSIMHAVREHEAGRRPADDQTIVTLGVMG